jgi:hypothetical protein
MKRFAKTRNTVTLACALALAGCGNSAEPGKPKAVIQQYVVTSAVDCADNTTMDFEVCTSLLQMAIDQHDRSASSFTKLSECETAQGVGRCNRIEEKKYRARIAAFQISMKEPPVAEPLYPTKTNDAAFRTASNTEIKPDADTYTFTKSAADATHLFVQRK